MKILFVCLGNICRSPMAEFVMKDMVRKAELAGNFEIASAATSREEIGNPVYPPAREKLREHGISCEGKCARQMNPEDYGKYDLLIGKLQRTLGTLHGKGHITLLFNGTIYPVSIELLLIHQTLFALLQHLNSSGNIESPI